MHRRGQITGTEKKDLHADATAVSKTPADVLNVLRQCVNPPPIFIDPECSYLISSH